MDRRWKTVGVPIVNKAEDVNDNFNYARNSFDECIQQIYSDVQMATDLLPLDYENIASNSQMPEKYRLRGTTVSQYNLVFGEIFRMRMSARIAMAFRAKAALLGASRHLQKEPLLHGKSCRL